MSSVSKRGHCASCLHLLAAEESNHVYCKACMETQQDNDKPVSSISFCGYSPSTTDRLGVTSSHHSACAPARLSKSLPVVCSPDAVGQNAANRLATPADADADDGELNSTSCHRPTDRLWQQIHSLNNDNDIHVRPICAEDDDDDLMHGHPTGMAVDSNDDDADDEEEEEDEEVEANDNEQEDVNEVAHENGSDWRLKETGVKCEQDGEDQEDELEDGEYLDDENVQDEEDIDDDDDVDVDVSTDDEIQPRAAAGDLATNEQLNPNITDETAKHSNDNNAAVLSSAAEVSLSLKEAADIASTAGKCRENTSNTCSSSKTVESHSVMETRLTDRCDCCSVLTHLKSRKHRHPLRTVHVGDVDAESCSDESPSVLCRLLTWFLLLCIVALLLLLVCNLRPGWCHWLRPFGILFNWQLRHVGGSPPI